jgi:2-isopropylmalate synthase
VSDQAGKSNVLDRLKTANIEVDAKDPAVDRILREVKDKEMVGYSYDGVGASFELMALAQLDRLPDFFDVGKATPSISPMTGNDRTAV